MIGASSAAKLVGANYAGFRPGSLSRSGEILSRHGLDFPPDCIDSIAPRAPGRQSGTSHGYEALADPGEALRKESSLREPFRGLLQLISWWIHVRRLA
jgi:hypothetical protein